MLIEIDIDFLIEHEITANHYLILYLLHKKKTSYLRKYVESNPLSEQDLIELKDKKFIHSINDDNEIDYNKLIVRPKFRSILSEGDFFDQLYDLYPTKAHRPDGKIDYLRSGAGKCRELYTKITKGGKNVHNKIIKCLEFEISAREREGSMKWFKKLYNWLDSEEWKNWEERMIDEPFVKNENTLGYGNELA